MISEESIKLTSVPQRPCDLYSTAQRRRFLIILFLVGTSNYIDKNIIGVLLEQIKAEFHVSDTQLGLLSGISFALFYAVLGIPVARWADRSDRKLIMTLSLVAWSAMTVLCGFAATFWQLAAARFGVGAGEAGAIPPAQSLLADYYPPTQRAQAIGAFMLSATAGYAIALVLGGWITQYYGWRTAFVVVGVLGLGLAPLTYSILREPRHHPKFVVIAEGHESIPCAVRALLGKRAYLNILAAMILYFLVAYGAHVFIVSVMIRTHHVTVAQAGAVFGTVAAVGALLGNLGGGVFADRLAARDVAWFARLTGWGLIAALPFFELTLLAPTILSMAVLLLLSEILMWGIVPPMFAALHLVCGSRRRAMSIAVAFFFSNLIGLGLGPVIAGAISDMLSKSYGSADGLRYSLMIVMTVFFPAGWFMLRAARHLKADAED